MIATLLDCWTVGRLDWLPGRGEVGGVYASLGWRVGWQGWLGWDGWQGWHDDWFMGMGMFSWPGVHGQALVTTVVWAVVTAVAGDASEGLDDAGPQRTP